MNEIAETSKGHHILLKGLEAAQVAVDQQVMRLHGLQATEFIACDETLVNHREHRHLSLKQAGRGLVDTRNQA